MDTAREPPLPRVCAQRSRPRDPLAPTRMPDQRVCRAPFFARGLPLCRVIMPALRLLGMTLSAMFANSVFARTFALSV